MHYRKFRSCLVAATALSGAFVSTAAWADCAAGAGPLATLVTCDSPGGIGTNGYDTGTNGITFQINSGAIVTTPPGGAGQPLLRAGTGSVVNNFSGDFSNGNYGIDAGSYSAPAITLGGGSTVNLLTNSYMQGAINLGNATGSAMNTVNVGYSATTGVAAIDGDITAQGNFTLNNQGFINWSGYDTITQTGAGTVLINNGVAGGYSAAVQLSTGENNAIMWSDIITQGSTTINNLADAAIYQNSIGIRIGTLGLGTSTINNAGTIGAAIEMSDATNVLTNSAGASITDAVTMNGVTNTLTNDGDITGNVTMNGTGANTYNAGSTGTAGDNGLRLPGSGTGILTGLAANSAHNTLNLNGTGASTLNAAAQILNFGVVNKNDAGDWTLKTTLDGAPGKLTAVNVTGGKLITDSAAFLGSAATTVKLSNATELNFNGTTAATFAGNIVDATGATTGKVVVTGAGATTLSGTNTYSGTTTIDGGTLITGSNGALSANSDFTIQNGGTLTVNHQVALKSVADGGTGPNTVNLNGTATSLTLTGGNWGANGGTVTGTGTLIKNGTGTLDLLGANAVNLTAPGIFQINNGTVNVGAAGAIGATTAVQVNSAGTAAGILNVNENDTIGTLAGTGANAQVNIASGKTLTIDGMNVGTLYAGKIAGAGALALTGPGTLQLNGVSTYTGGTTIGAGAGLIGYAGSSTTNGSLQGDFALNATGSLTFNQSLSPYATGLYAGAISGAGWVNFQGNGTNVLTLSGNNSGLTGWMYFLAGSKVAVSAANNLGVGTLSFDGGTLMNTATMTLANAVDLAGAGTFDTASGTTLTLSGVISGPGGLTKSGTGTLALTGANTYTGGTTVSAGTLTGVAGTGLQGNIAAASGATVKFTGSGTYAGNLSGAGAVVIDTTDTTFTGTNTYSGSTTINSGATLNAGAANLSTSSAVTNNGTLALTGNNSVAGLSGSGTTDLAGNNLTIGTGTSSSYSGALNGGGTLTVASGAGSWTFSGTTGTALTSFVNNGRTVLDGSLAATAGTNNGTLSGTGTFTGALTNAGTIAPGHSPGIINVVGSFTQTSAGTYTAEVNGNGTSTVVAGTDFDRIAVTGTPGTASLAGTLAITQNGGLYVAGTTYDVITTTGGITGNFGTITGNVISPFVKLSNLTADGGGIVGNNYRLIVVRSAYSTVAGDPNEAAVATGLQALVPVSAASPTVIKIDNMTAAQAQALFNTVSPEGYGAYASALEDQGDLFTRQVDYHLVSTEVDGKTGLWINGYGSWANGKNKDYRWGSDQRITGLAVGVDGALGGVRLGLAGGYSEDKVTYLQGNSSGKNKSWQLGAYMAYRADRLHVEGQLAYVSGSINATKTVLAGSGSTLISGTAMAETKGHVFKGQATIGYDFGDEKMTFRPFIGVDFTSGQVNGFTETGMGVLNLTVDRIKASRTDVTAGFKLAAPMGMITPYVNATYRYAINNDARDVTAWFNGLSASPFTVSAIGSGKSVFDVDAGFSAKLGENMSLFAGYQGTYRNDVTAHGINGGLRMSF